MINIGNTQLRNPIIGASGCSGWGEEIQKYNDFNKIGGFITKSITLKEKIGNKGKRLYETKSGLLNSIGLENAGVEYFIENTLPKIKNYNCSVFLNIAPFSKEELIEIIKILDKEVGFSGYEINISCPNVHNGGKNFNSDYNESIALLKDIRKLTNKTLIVKLSPAFNVSYDIAQFAEKEGFDAISFTNTFLGTAINIEKRKFIFENKVAGLSGPAIKPLSLWAVYQMVKTVNIPVIGIGGIRTINDVLEYLIIGAKAVQICTGLLIQPNLLEKLSNELEQYLKINNISIEQIIGSIKE